ncbi:MAG: cupin domain-containing protein [Hyphomicrobiaceae bacterium]|nr:cupin domain-containing protein [Hyphomicrobiaceae bacterium]
MSIVHHPDPSNLMCYAAGSLPEPLAAVVACHVSVCPECRRDVAMLEIAGADLVTSLAGVEMLGDASRPVANIGGSADTYAVKQTMAVKKKTGGADVPAPLIRLVGPRLDGITWKYLAPGVRHHPLPLSKGAQGDLRLLKIAAGMQMPEHGHGGAEMTMLLAGAYSDAFGRFTTGDVSDLDTDSEHQPIADPEEGCICLFATLAPSRYKSPLAKLMQRFTGI